MSIFLSLGLTQKVLYKVLSISAYFKVYISIFLKIKMETPKFIQTQWKE